MRYPYLKKPVVKRVIAIVALYLLLQLLMLFARHPQAVEQYYSQGLYKGICLILHPVLNILPFSLGDIFYISVVCAFIYALFRVVVLLIKTQFKRAAGFFLGIVIAVQAGIIIFYLLWGLNYFRPSAATRLGLRDSTLNFEDLKAVTNQLIDSANTSRGRLTSADFKKGNDTIYQQAISAVKQLGSTSVSYHTYSPRIKPSLLTFITNYIGTSGYYNPFTTEAQLNYQMPVHTRPFVACHEMAHQMGYGPEDEANFVGYLAASRSADKLLQYSAYYQGLQECMYSLRAKDSVTYKAFKKKISPQVLADYKAERLYWLSYINKLNAISSVFYDNFLKANNQPEGMRRYNRMVALLMAEYKKEGTI
ncbi:DUF3810 domain-containing protein [Mucilaginibacter pallidiroseus]|uniref:DUF3810 domain-containing protein n=1 Tax=Mucilaginibacter pallidiroseus TaxID=2599295 RepID=A0A563U520_9SPHI|nr:DUF3810 domain-containing protein [Mucilaginibacter pallidiroseus]TWR26428.1 DUF3810 domain-containing protein [Mucilaginibacter pallidiroseus]